MREGSGTEVLIGSLNFELSDLFFALAKIRVGGTRKDSLISLDQDT